MTATARRAIQLAQPRVGRAMCLVVDDEPVLLVGQEDTVHALSADCPHAGASFEEGVVCNGHIVCLWHKAAFDIATGDEQLPPPAITGLDRDPVTISNGEVTITRWKMPRHDNTATFSNSPKFVVTDAGARRTAALRLAKAAEAAHAG